MPSETKSGVPSSTPTSIPSYTPTSSLSSTPTSGPSLSPSSTQSSGNDSTSSTQRQPGNGNTINSSNSGTFVAFASVGALAVVAGFIGLKRRQSKLKLHDVSPHVPVPGDDDHKFDIGQTVTAKTSRGGIINNLYQRKSSRRIVQVPVPMDEVDVLV